MPHSDRIAFIDILRGIAVVVMVMGHSIDAVLDAGSRASDIFQVYQFFRGFTAPLFLFVAGLAFSVATAKRWEEYTAWTPALRKRILRAFLLLGVGYALHLPFFSAGKILSSATGVELARLFQADVLHCVAAALLILHGVILSVRTREAFTLVVLGLSLLFMTATPLLSTKDLSPVVSPILSPYFNQQQISLFPLFPFAAFLFSGVAAGQLFLRPGKEDASHDFARSMAVGAAVLAGVAVIVDALPFSLFPAHSFWNASPLFFSIKLSVVCLISAGVASLGHIPQLLQRQLSALGQSSLLVYAVHIAIVYGSAANTGLLQAVGRNLSPAGTAGVALMVLVTMVFLVHGWNYLATRHHTESRYLQAGFAATLLYLFLLRPY